MPRTIDHHAREVEVAEAAWRVLLRHGIQGLSVRAVAAEAGLAMGSLRRSFPSQGQLLVACIRLVDERVQARVLALPADPDPLRLAESALAQTLPLDHERRVEMQVWLALSIGSLTDATLRAECATVDAHLGELVAFVLAELQRAGVLRRGLDLAGEAHHLHALLDGLALHLVKQPPEADPGWALAVLRDHLAGLAGSAG